MNILQLAFLALISIHLAQAQAKPKIPLYIGKGYNILLGNPLSTEGIDPGYQNQIFDFTYYQNQTTEDQNYLIPDGISSKNLYSCSFTTSTNEYRGTQTYQNSLKTIISIGGNNSTLMNAAFSASATYQKVNNSIYNQSIILTHAAAECQAYQMSLNTFSPGKISDSFWVDVDNSLKSNDWSLFIEHFGTHFVYDVTLGGRAVQEIQYDSKGIAILGSLNISTDLAAKASFAAFYNDTSFNYSAYSSEIKYASILSQSINQYYMGGASPSNGTIKDWANGVIKAPMSISYRVLPLSNLFEFHPSGPFDFNSATTKFLAALDSYCENRTCRLPGPDQPRPQPASYESKLTETYGQPNGSYFGFNKFTPVTYEVTKIKVHSGTYLESIQIEIGDAVSSVLSSEMGNVKNKTNDRAPWIVPKGESITQIQLYSGIRIDSITFVTNMGNKSPRYGGGGGTYHEIPIPLGYKFVGVYGTQNYITINTIQFWISKIVYDVHEEPELIKKELRIDEE